jgi:hypothetical protein
MDGCYSAMGIKKMKEIKHDLHKHTKNNTKSLNFNSN